MSQGEVAYTPVIPYNDKNFTPASTSNNALQLFLSKNGITRTADFFNMFRKTIIYNYIYGPPVPHPHSEFVYVPVNKIWYLRMININNMYVELLDSDGDIFPLVWVDGTSYHDIKLDYGQGVKITNIIFNPATVYIYFEEIDISI